MKRSSRKKNRINPYLGYGLLIALAVVYYGKDSLYFNNGARGANWRIGAPLANPLPAFPTRSLSELRQQALLLVNRDRKLNLHQNSIKTKFTKKHKI